MGINVAVDVGGKGVPVAVPGTRVTTGVAVLIGGFGGSGVGVFAVPGVQPEAKRLSVITAIKTACRVTCLCARIEYLAILIMNKPLAHDTLDTFVTPQALRYLITTGKYTLY
jgi:hypothetical protein